MTPIVIHGLNPRALGCPSTTYYIYVDAVNGDDGNRGFGTDDPDLSENWNNAVQTLDYAAFMVPPQGITVIVTRGDLELSLDHFPYFQYNGFCIVVSNDELFEYATGTITGWDTSPAKIPQWPEMTVNWDAPFVPTDEVVRAHFLEYERDDMAAIQVAKAGGYDAGDGSHWVLEPYANTAIGRAVRLVGPSSELSLTNYTTVYNTYFSGYSIVGGAVGALLVNEVGLGCWRTEACGIGLCEMTSAFSLPIITQVEYCDIYRTACTWLARTIYDFLGTVLEEGNPAPIVPGAWVSSSAGAADRRTQHQHGTALEYGVVWDGISCYAGHGTYLEAKYSRMVDDTHSQIEIYSGAAGDFISCKCSRIVGDEQSPRLTMGDSSLSSGAGGTDPLLELYPGSVLRLHPPSDPIAFEGPQADRVGAQLLGVGSSLIKFVGGFDVATPATSTPLVVMRGGYHEDLDFDLAGQDRGPGPLVHADHLTSIVMEDGVSGDNSNAGGYGLELRHGAHADIDATFALTGNSGAEARVYLGVKALRNIGAAGTTKNDLPAGAATAGTEEMVSISTR